MRGLFRDIYHFFRFGIKRRIQISEIWRKGSKHIFPFDMKDGMLEINFTMLKVFMEKGQLDIIDWEHDDAHRNTKKELDRLYFWWTKLRDKHKDRVETLFMKGFAPLKFNKLDNDHFEMIDTATDRQKWIRKKVSKMETWLEGTEQKNLEKLISLRGWLWT